MLSRRNFTASATAAALMGPSGASAYVGSMGAPEMLATMAGLAAVEQGDGTRTIHVLVSPGCDHSLRMWDAVQTRLPAARFRWIPYAPRPQLAPVVARILELGDAAAMRSALAGAPLSGSPSPVAMRIAAMQDERIDLAVARMAYAATARPLATPTTVYSSPLGPVVARGSLTPALLDTVLSDAV